MPLRKLVGFQSVVALCLVFSPVGLEAQNESASALAQQITDALKTKKPDWKYIAAIESTHFPLVPSEKRIIVGDWSSPESPTQFILVSVYSVDSSGEAAKWLGPVRNKQVAAGWTVARFQIGDEGYLSKYKNGERFDIEFRKGSTVARISGDDRNTVKEFAQCIVEQIPASRGAQPTKDRDRSFHEKACPRQDCSALSMSSSLFFPFSQAASVATLPSALLYERFSLGASWVFSIH